MKLSSHSRIVTAIFDSPVPVENASQGSEIVYYFQVGPLIYRSRFFPKPENSYEYSFRIWEVTGSPAQKVQFWSKFFDRDVTQADADFYSQPGRFPVARSFKITKTGSAGRVFGAVLNVIKQFVNEYKPTCLVFSSSEDSRTDLYRAIVKRYFKDHHTTEEIDGPTTIFEVCFSESEP
jgi:hypothetical protein